MYKNVWKTIRVSIVIIMTLAPCAVFALEEPMHSTVPAGNFYFPLPAGNVTLNRGLMEGVHNGYDFHVYQSHRNDDTPNSIQGSCLDYGIPILASMGGKVSFVSQTGWGGGFGTYVRVSSDNYDYYYGHMIENTIQVKTDQTIEAGTLLGLMASTGISEGTKCTLTKENPSTGKNENIEVNGVHLHFDIRDKSIYEDAVTKRKYTVFHKVDNFIGGENYADSSLVANGHYTSTTKMKDPTGYWAKYGYRYDYILPADAIGEMPNPKLITFTPLIVKKGESTTYTITGELLGNIQVDIPGCEIKDENWIKDENGRKGMEKQQFRCANGGQGLQTGKIIVKGLDGKDIFMEVGVDVINQNDNAQGGASIDAFGLVDINENIRPNQATNFQIKGKNLPGDLIVDMPACESITYKKRTPTLQVFECKVSPSSYTAEGKRYNKTVSQDIKIKDASGKILFNSSVDLNYKVRVTSVEPKEAYYGQKTRFVFKGEGMDLVGAYHVDDCANLIRIEQSNKNELILECIPLVDEKLFSPLMPNIFKKGEHSYVLKDKSGGTKLFEGKITVKVQDPFTWVENITPINPMAGNETRFTVKGNNLPDSILVWIGDCGSGSATTNRSSASFNCTPGLVSGEMGLAEIKNSAVNAEKDPQAFIKAVEKQKRTVEIKYPREYSRINTTEKPIVIYRGEILPIPKEYNSFYFKALDAVIGKKSSSALFLNSDDNEAVIKYILENRFNYSNTFLKKFGWEVDNAGNYKLRDCSDELEAKSGMVFFPSESYSPPKLNTVGNCANGLDNIFLKDAERRLYPKMD